MTFLADVHLGKLARILRLLGFDVYWRNDLDDFEITSMSRSSGRVVLSRDRELLKRKAIVRKLYILSTDPIEQTAQVIREFGLLGDIAPFTRCSACGSPLQNIGEPEIADGLPASVKGKYSAYFRCTACGKLFWKGDHFRTMGVLLERIEKALGTKLRENSA